MLFFMFFIKHVSCGTTPCSSTQLSLFYKSYVKMHPKCYGFFSWGKKENIALRMHFNKLSAMLNCRRLKYLSWYDS
jgi:hypothetical protein